MVTIIDKDMGYKKILKTIETLSDRPFINVGYLENSGIHKDSDGMTVAEVAVIHEFGSKDGKIPERSHIRSTYDEKKDYWREKTNRLGFDIVTGKMSINRGLGILGQIISTDFKKKINSGDFVENAPSTIARKGSSRPLIDTAQMRNSIKYERGDK